MIKSMHRVAARIAVVALLGPLLAGMLGVAAAPQAGADPLATATVGAGFSELIEDEQDRLCDDGKDCDTSSPEFWEATLSCAVSPASTPPVSRDGIGFRTETKFFACMSEEGFGEAPEEDEEDPLPTLSLGKVSSSLTGFYVSELSPSGGGARDEEGGQAHHRRHGGGEAEIRGLDAWAPILSHPAQAGAFVGALDRTDKETAEENSWLFSPGNSANTSEVRYSAFNRDLRSGGLLGSGGGIGTAGQATSNTGQTVPDAGVEAYLTYGALLSGLGLDSTINPESSASLLTSQGMRGYALLVAYMGAGAIDTFFATVVEALQWLNPFRFMVDAVASSTGSEVTAGMAGEANDRDSAFQGLRDMFTQIYSALVSIGWMIVVPLLLVFLLLGMTMFRSAQTAGRAKKLVIIVAFLALGLPLLGTMYTAGLSAMAGASVDSARANSTKVVLSTLVDFEGWVSQSRLSPPPVLENDDLFGWNGVANSPIGQSEAMVRRLAESVNSANHAGYSGHTALGPVDPRQSIDLGDDRTWSTSVISRRGDGSALLAPGVGVGAESFGAVRDLIQRYATGATVSATGFESEVKGSLVRAINSATDQDQAKVSVAGWFEELSDPEHLADMTSADVARLRNPLLQVGEGAGLGARPQAEGDDEAGAWSYAALAQPDCHLDGPGGVVPAGWDGSPDTALVPCGLSVLSMYNYLNTSFGTTSMEAFSPATTSNPYTRVNHASVSSVGAGPAGILYFFSAMTVLSSFVIIGFLYALGMMFSSIKRSFGLIGAALGSAVGLMSAIAKVVVLTAALFIELFATLFLYKVVQEFIVIVPTLLEKPLAERLSSAPEAGSGLTATGTGQAIMNAEPESQWGAAAAAAGAAVSLTDSRSLGIVALMITLVTTVSLLIFTFMAVKLRRGLLDAIDQGVTSLVNKFTESDVQGAMTPEQPGAFRTGLSRGGSMAMTSMMMGGGPTVEMVGGGDSADSEAEVLSDTTRVRIQRTDGSVFMIEGPTEGAPGIAGSGAMQAQQGGGMIDAAGSPVVDHEGSQVTLGDLVPIDASSGQVLESPGGAPVAGADGSPLAAADIAGFNHLGQIIDEQGRVIENSNGEALVSPAAGQISAQLMGDERLAAQVTEHGLSTHSGQMISPLTGQTLGPEAVATGARGSVATLDSGSARTQAGPVDRIDRADRDDEGRSVLGTAAMATAGGVASSVLSGQRKRLDPLGVRGGRGQGPIPKSGRGGQ